MCLSVVFECGAEGFCLAFRQLILDKSSFHSPAIPGNLFFHLSRKLSLLVSGKTWVSSSSTCLPKRLFGGTYNGVHMQKILQSQVKLPSAKFHGAVCTNDPEGFLVVSRGFVVGSQAGVLTLSHTFGLPPVSGETRALVKSFSITHCSKICSSG